MADTEAIEVGAASTQDGLNEDIAEIKLADAPSEGVNGSIAEKEAAPVAPVKVETEDDSNKEPSPVPLAPALAPAPPIQSIIVSSKPFAAGVNATVFHCEVVFASASVSRDEKAPGPTSSTSSTALACDTPTILKINRPSEDEADHQLSAPLLLADSHWWCPIEYLDEIVDQELTIYKALEPLQGNYVPRFFGTLEPSVTPQSHCKKLVLENGGTPLSSFAAEYPKLYRLWSEEIEDRAMEAIDACHGLKVTHHGLRVDNVLVHWSVKRAAAEADVPEQQKEWWKPFEAKRPASADGRGMTEDEATSKDANTNVKIYSLAEVEKRCQKDGQLQIPSDLQLHVYLIDWRKGKIGKKLWRVRDEFDKLGERLIKLLASVDKKIKAAETVDPGPAEPATPGVPNSPDP